MTRRSPLRLAPLLAAALCLSVIALVWWRSHRGTRPVFSSAAGAEEGAPGGEVEGMPAQGNGETAIRARYHLTSEHFAIADGRSQASVRIEGEWTLTGRAAGRTEARFAATTLAAAGEKAPSPAEVAGPIELVKSEGVLAAIAFPDEMPRAARALLTGLATTFQFTDRPGETWTVEEEDLMGRYVAEYHRTGPDRVTRKRTRYTGLRGRGGLSSAEARGLQADETSELRVDRNGVVSASVTVGWTMSITRGQEPLRMSMQAKMERVGFDVVPLTAGLGLSAGAISDHVDRAALAHRRDLALVAGETTPQLLAGAERVAHLDRTASGTNQARAEMLRRLSAQVRLDPQAAGALAVAIRQRATDRDQVNLIAGALSSSDVPAGANALASLLADDKLPPQTRSVVITDLALANAPTIDSARALAASLGGAMGNEAALALGSEAGKLGADGQDLIDELLQRYAAASSRDERRVYLLALANSGDRKVLPTLLDAIRGGDFELSRAATFGLRLVPGDDVDELLLTLIQGASPVVIEAIQATGYRSAELWKPRLLAIKPQYENQKRVLDTIQAMLSHWGNVAE